MIIFSFLDKLNSEKILPILYDILYKNMSEIVPTGNVYSKDYKIWIKNIIPALKKEPRKIILIFNDNEIIGYFQYYINKNLFMMEEIQIKKQWQGGKVFRKLFWFIIENIPENILLVEAYANKKNYKSIEILKHLGLFVLEENRQNFHFRGKYKNLQKWYENT